MRRPLSLATATVAGCCLLSACALLPNRQSEVRPTSAAVDSIAARLAELELQRITIEAGNAPQVVSAMSVDAQVGALVEQLRALPNHEFTQRIVTERVLLALDARESSVADRIRSLRLMYTDAHPAVRQALDEEKLLNQRRVDLRAELTRDGAGSH